MVKEPRFCRKHHQSGVALMIVLVLMVVVSMLGMTALKTSRIEEQLAGATFDHIVARSAGDAAMVDAYQYVFSPGFSHSLMPPAKVLDPVMHGWTVDSWRLADFDWSPSAVKAFGTGGVDSTLLTHLNVNPTYVVENLPMQITQATAPLPVLRVTVRSIGARTSTENYSMALIMLPTN